MIRRFNKFLDNLSGKFRLVLFNDQTYEKTLSFSFRLRNLMFALSFLFILFFFLTFVFISYTPLRTFVPGFDEVQTSQKLGELLTRTDSLERSIRVKREYIENLRNIFSGESPLSDLEISESSMLSSDGYFSRDNPSFADSLNKVNVDLNEFMYFIEAFDNIFSISQIRLRDPVQGIITDSYNPDIGHFASDIVAPKGTSINAPIHGRVVFAEWSSNTGYVIVLQHPGNLITVYKHNESLLQEVGNFVKAGDPIAVIGGSGELATGPHLHFEMWYKGRPLDPEQFFTF